MRDPGPSLISLEHTERPCEDIPENSKQRHPEYPKYSHIEKLSRQAKLGNHRFFWVAVEELKLQYYNKEPNDLPFNRGMVALS